MHQFLFLCFKILEATDKDKSGYLNPCETFITECVCRIFERCAGTRGFVFAQLSRVSSNGGSTLLKILLKLVEKSPLIVLEYSQSVSFFLCQLKEMCEQVFHLNAQTANLLLQSVAEIACISIDSALFDRLVMILRKCMIQKDLAIREISVDGTMLLLDACARNKKTDHVHELISISRRFFSHQYEVRELIYLRLLHFTESNATYQYFILELLSSHVLLMLLPLARLLHFRRKRSCVCGDFLQMYCQRCGSRTDVHPSLRYQCD